MRRVLVRGSLVAAVSVAVLAAGVPALATTVPDDTSPSNDAVSDPGLEAAIAVFEERMADAGFENLGPAPEVESSDETDTSEEFADCAPEVRDAMTTFEEMINLSSVGAAPQVASDRFGPAETTGTESVPTTTDPFSALLAGSEEVSALLYRLDDEQVAAVDQTIEVMGSPAFTECFEMMMAATPDMTDVSIPEFSDLSIPDLSDLSIPDLSDLSIPDLSDLSIPDLSDLSIPELTDLSIPDFSDMSIPELTDLSIPEIGTPEFEVTSEADLGIGDSSARFGFSGVVMMDIGVDTVIVRSGDVLIAISHSRFGTPSEPMELDLEAEAQAIVDSL